MTAAAAARGVDARPPSRPSQAGSLVRAMRPRQWVKNLLLLAAPLAAGVAITSASVGRLGVALVVFCAASSAGYLVNDAADAAADRLHPEKRHRPVAAGLITVRTAVAAAGLLAAGAVAGAAALGRQFVLVVLAYLVVTLAYSSFLKRQPVFDLAAVSFGFLLRAIAGGVVLDVPLSQWFLLVTAFGSLFVVAGKRYAEVHRRRSSDLSTDETGYSEGYLRFVLTLAATTTVVFYVLWTVVVAKDQQQLWAQVSIAPFTLAILRYGADIDRGRGGAPEEVVLRDRGLQAIGLVWLVTFVVAAYVA